MEVPESSGASGDADSSSVSECPYKTGDSRIEMKMGSRQPLVCVEFPGVVNDVNKAFDTFGGVRGLVKACNDESKRLEMRWRKGDIYCKPMYGDRQNTTNLLIRVRRRRRKVEGQAEREGEPQYEYKVDIEGLITTTYQFHGMADFQFLPIERQADGSQKNLLNDLVLTGLTDREEFLGRDVPLFMPPMIFSRIDTPVEYMYRPDRGINKKALRGLAHLPTNLIATGRQKRTIFTIFKTFDEPTPEGPPEGADSVLTLKLKNTNLRELVIKLFEERPIWSKNGIRFHLPSKFHPRLKYVFPLVAYYFVNGPWRTLWVRFGYDPRKDSSSKMYQILDFRLRQRGAAEKLEIGGKRSSFNYKLPTTKTRSQMKIPKIHTSTLAPDKTNTTDVKDFPESTYVFEPDVLPPYRQMFYQLCDIREDSIQKLAHENDGKEETCTEKDGWLTGEVYDQSREILFKHVDSILGRQFYPIPDPGTRRGRHIVSKIRGLLDAPGESEDESELEPATATGEEEEEEEEDINEMETEMMECV